jgi:hypothetical protein
VKFSEINNIWMPDIGGLSNADRGRVYFERAKQVVDEVLACPSRHAAAVDGGHFRRSYLIERIGCQPSVTTQNPKIRRLLGDADRRLREDGNTANRSAEHVRPSNPSPMERKSQPGYDLRSSDGIIVLTDITCIVKGQPWPGIPTLVWPDGVDEAASDWLRTLVVENDVSLSSAREYAKIIRPFLRFCRERGRIWTTACGGK